MGDMLVTKEKLHIDSWNLNGNKVDEIDIFPRAAKNPSLLSTNRSLHSKKYNPPGLIRYPILSGIQDTTSLGNNQSKEVPGLVKYVISDQEDDMEEELRPDEDVLFDDAYSDDEEELEEELRP